MSLGDVVLSVDGHSMQGKSIGFLRDSVIGAVGTFVHISFDSAWCTHVSSPRFHNSAILYFAVGAPVASFSHPAVSTRTRLTCSDGVHHQPKLFSIPTVKSKF